MPLPKDKKKLSKLIQESDSDDSEHELAYYVNDRVKLMKEVLKIIKPKKIKMMAPACLKDIEIEEVNSMLLEELLGISNKRLRYIFKGQNLDENSSSTDEDDPIDIISLDDISNDDFIINLDEDEDKIPPKRKKVKKELKHTKIKKEKDTKNKSKTRVKKENEKSTEKPVDSNENLMSVLELLELQARARAIKSQLLLENSKTQESISAAKAIIEEKVGSDDDVIIESVKTEEIVITSSESEDESSIKNNINDEPSCSNSGTNTAIIIENANDDTNKNQKNNEKVDTETNKIVEEESQSNKINIIEIKNISNDEIVEHVSESSPSPIEQNKDLNEKLAQNINDEIIVINLSNDEIEELK